MTVRLETDYVFRTSLLKAAAEIGGGGYTMTFNRRFYVNLMN
jgi:hypothetical protein